MVNKRTKVSAAPFVFFSPPSSKLFEDKNRMHPNIKVNALFATLQRHLHLVFAHSALQPQHNLLRCLRLVNCSNVSPPPERINNIETDLLVEDGFGLTTIS